MINDRCIVLENEQLAVRDSGELPEIAYHSSIYYLTEDEKGPRLRLSEQEREQLLEAARWRYQDIILRDMLPENRGKSFCRGIRRSMENWRRFKMFHRRHKVGLLSLQKEAALALKTFLATEVDEGIFPSDSVNCSFQELLSFASELGLSRQELPENLERYFRLNGG
jgi:hypothetical protein